MTRDFTPFARRATGIVCLLIAAGLGIGACLVEQSMVVPLAIAAGIPLAALGGSLLVGHDRHGDKGVIGPFTLYVMAAGITFATIAGLFSGKPGRGFGGMGVIVAGILALAAKRRKRGADLSQSRDPRERNL